MFPYQPLNGRPQSNNLPGKVSPWKWKPNWNTAKRRTHKSALNDEECCRPKPARFETLILVSENVAELFQIRLQRFCPCVNKFVENFGAAYLF
jgi:hypothetical protein